MVKSIKAQIIAMFIVALTICIIGGSFFALEIKELLKSYGETSIARNNNSFALRSANEHYRWIDNLNSYIFLDKELTDNLELSTCLLGKWMSGDDISTFGDAEIESALQRVVIVHQEIHELASEVLVVKDSDEQKAIDILENKIRPDVDLMIDNLNEMSMRYDSIAQENSKILNSSIINTTIIAIIVLVVNLLIFALMAYIVMNLIVNPVIHITDVAKRISNGDLSARATVSSQAEIRVLADSLNAAASNLERYVYDISETMQALANNDLTVLIDREYIGDFVPIKESINRFLSQMNVTISAIKTASAEVNESSSYVSDFSLRIAEGSTVQANSLTELTKLIKIVSDGASEATSNANRANELSLLSNEKLEVSNEKMNYMLESIEEISESSKQIEKIIKTIDDIAFQTNILALNAAIEAARAGAVGKGFAVVADEVRNLAIKSAEAAKGTTSLIESSIFSVDKGTKIAQETATALSSVIQSAKESVVYVNKIVSIIGEQAASLEDITYSAGEISRVVEQNSGSSEESASASQQLSTQARLMNELTSPFRLGEKSIKWTRSLSVNVPLIDDQHKMLFDKINELFDACNEQKSGNLVLEALGFLDDYTKTHFGDEEKYMIEINYPRYSIQKKLHTKFIDELKNLKNEYINSGQNSMIILNANKLIVDWLIKHISFEDKKLGEFVENNKL